MPTIEFPDGMSVEEALERAREHSPHLFAESRPEPEPAADEPDKLLTPQEVAAMFRVDPKTVTRWAKAGKLSSTRTPGGHRRYRETEVRALLAGAPQEHAA